MSKDLHQRDAAQARGSKLLLAMGIIVLLGALAYFILTLVVNRRSDANYQVVLFQRGDKDTYADFIQQSESDLKEAYGVISPRKVNLSVDGATVTAVRCDIQAYYAVLATITYDSGDVVYVSGLTKLASISDIVNLVESVRLS